MERKLLSIIIPHYNSPRTLRKLLDSIPRIDDIEIIVIDDNSDMLVDELHEIMRNEEYSHVVFLKNVTKSKGPGTCRNIGLSYAKGEWILFADADDYFLEGFFEKVTKYFSTDYDVVFFMPTSTYLKDGKKATRHLPYEKLIKKYMKSAKYSEIRLRYRFRSPCSKLMRKEFLDKNNIRFDNIIVCENDMFSVKIGYLMKKFTATSDTIYCITQHETSLSNRKGSKYFKSYLNAILMVDRFLRSKLDWKEYRQVTTPAVKILYRALYNRVGIKELITVVGILFRYKIPLI